MESKMTFGDNSKVAVLTKNYDDRKLVIYDLIDETKKDAKYKPSNTTQFIIDSENILAIVNEKDVYIYDKNIEKIRGHLNMKRLVKNVLVTKNSSSIIVVVIVSNRIYCYSYQSHNLSLVKRIETIDNNNTACVVDINGIITIAFPCTEQGKISISHIDCKETEEEKKLGNIKAHKENISALTIHPVKNIIASTSKRGTIVRVFDINDDGKQICEFRRGKNSANIYSLCFNNEGTHLLCSSDTGTIHVFSLQQLVVKEEEEKLKEVKEEEKVKIAKNTTSYLSFASSVLPNYFSSSWSFCKIKLPSNLVPHICKFGKSFENIIYVACFDETFYKINYELDGTFKISQLFFDK
jgi:WD40 repeat protein